jgi:hypothetical protein
VALVLAAAGCAPGGSSHAAALAGPSPATASLAPAPGVTADAASLTVPVAKPTAASTFVGVPDPDGGARARSRVTLLSSGAALVTGGVTAKGATGQVLYYDPVAASFTVLAGAELAFARYDHEATLLPSGSEVLVTGGFDGHTQLASVELIELDLKSPQASRSQQLSALPEGRAEHRAVLVPVGAKTGKPWSGGASVLVVGGCVARPGRNAVPSSSSFLYTLETGADGHVRSGRAVPSASQPRVARFGHQAILLPGADRTLGTDDDRVLVWGGFGADADAVGEETTMGPLAAPEVYEPSLDRWSTVRVEGTAPAPRFEHRMALTADGGALIVGGQSSTTPPVAPASVATLELDAHDPTLGRAGTGANLAHGRVAPEIATLEDGRILVSGGFDPVRNVALDDAEVLSANGQSVEPPVSIGQGRYDHGLAAIGLSQVLVFGGRSSPETFGSPSSGLLLLLDR